MNLPDLNRGGYVNASISNVTGFSKVDYLLAHGSGDDNVHYANSAHMLDMLTQAKVRNFRFWMFTDRSVPYPATLIWRLFFSVLFLRIDIFFWLRIHGHILITVMKPIG